MVTNTANLCPDAAPLADIGVDHTNKHTIQLKLLDDDPVRSRAVQLYLGASASCSRISVSLSYAASSWGICLASAFRLKQCKALHLSCQEILSERQSAGVWEHDMVKQALKEAVRSPGHCASVHVPRHSWPAATAAAASLRHTQGSPCRRVSRCRCLPPMT